MIFQLIDDHSRYAVASHVASGETAKDAIAVFDKAVTAHGVPQRLLSDNGLALNPSRRGIVGQLVAHVAALGTEAITGKPYKPTTQGKNERFHQTLFRYLDKQPLADVAGRAPGAGRQVRPHLQHPAPPPRTARAHHAGGRVGGDPQGRSAPPETGQAHLRGARPQRASPTKATCRPTRRHAHQNRQPGSVTEVLTHQPSPMS